MTTVSSNAAAGNVPMFNDSISAGSAIIGLNSYSSHVGNTIGNVYINSPEFYEGSYEDLLLKFEINRDLLQAIGERMLDSGTTSKMVTPCLSHCRRSLEEVEKLVAKVQEAKLNNNNFHVEENRMKRAIDGFSDAVKLLQDISNEATNQKLQSNIQNLLANLAHLQSFQLKALHDTEKWISELRDSKTIDQSGEQLRLNLEALAEKLENNSSQMQTWHPDNSDPFCFSATIIHPGELESKHTAIRGKLDSGCDEDWISSEIIKRAALEADVLPLEYPDAYIGFGGQPFQPSGTINITWYASNAGMTRETTFLVHNDVPFDMILGKIFIKEQSVFVFDKAALALRQGRFTREEMREIEENARKNGATNAQLASIRRADAASARERLRQQKAASRLATPGMQTPGSFRSGYLTPAIPARPRGSTLQSPPSSVSQSTIQTTDQPGTNSSTSGQSL